MLCFRLIIILLLQKLHCEMYKNGYTYSEVAILINKVNRTYNNALSSVQYFVVSDVFGHLRSCGGLGEQFGPVLGPVF